MCCKCTTLWVQKNPIQFPLGPCNTSVFPPLPKYVKLTYTLSTSFWKRSWPSWSTSWKVEQPSSWTSKLAVSISMAASLSGLQLMSQISSNPRMPCQLSTVQLIHRLLLTTRGLSKNSSQSLLQVSSILNLFRIQPSTCQITLTTCLIPILKEGPINSKAWGSWDTTSGKDRSTQLTSSSSESACTVTRDPTTSTSWKRT